MSASFSKHTFSRSIFRTVTCNKVVKERRCSCLFVSDLDLGTVSLSGPKKNEHFFFLSPSHALLRLRGVHLWLFPQFSVSPCHFSRSLRLPFLFPPCNGRSRLLLRARRRGICFLRLKEEDRLEEDRLEEVGSSRKPQMCLAERNS